MRMIFADDIAHHPRAFLVGAGRIKLEQPHRPQQPPMHRLQPIAHIGQRPSGDRREGINQIPLGQSAIERRIDDEVGGKSLHWGSVARGAGASIRMRMGGDQILSRDCRHTYSKVPIRVARPPIQPAPPQSAKPVRSQAPGDARTCSVHQRN
jgi:hypothetical protein